MYKPNFCAECGERVLRERWRVWTSRRFCPACAPRLRRNWRAPLLACCALLGAGFAAGRLMRPAPPPLTIERGSLPLPGLLAKSAAGQARDASVNGAASNAPSQTGSTRPVEGDATNFSHDGAGALERTTDPDELVYICGARTKKGAPCQRRVRGAFRCWQHRGMPAILPPEKLILRN